MMSSRNKGQFSGNPSPATSDNTQLYNVPGAFATPSRTHKSLNRHRDISQQPHSKSKSKDSELEYPNTQNLSENQSQEPQHVYRTLRGDSNLATPKSVHTRSDSSSIQMNVSPLIRSRSKKKQTNYLKLIPPMNDQRSDPRVLPTSSTQQVSHPFPSKLPAQQTHLTTSTSTNRVPADLPTRGISLCSTCNKPITTKSVKALGKRYHTHCFVCADCGTPILSKYFPYEDESGEKIPLCEEHFYKRRGLTCCVCNSYLKGTHYTVFGRKYDSEHFCCKICSKKFDTDEDFFNHDGSIYCHYHFSKFFIERCEGCEFAILKQYVEIFRGGRNQKWHVECYMIHKCWNVSISPNSIGVSAYPRIEPTEENIRNSSDTNPTPEELISTENRASEKISEIWTTLFRFEEDTAACISDMLQFATVHDKKKGLVATTRLILKIDALFRSLDSLHKLGIDSHSNYFSTKLKGSKDAGDNDNNNFQTLKKEPRNLSAKIMIYLAILRKVSKGITAPSTSQDLILSVVTGLAHYLKLLIRYGLHNSLQYDKISHSTTALDKFLRDTRAHEHVPEDPLDKLDIPLDASDLCFECQKSIENSCIQYQDKRWHIECLSCSRCHKHLQSYSGIADASFNTTSNQVFCAQCSLDDPAAMPGFKAVSKLLQLSYLLKIAIVRSKAVMEHEMQTEESGDLAARENLANEQSYMKTLNDIKRLRSTRQDTRINNSISKENARKSIVIEETETKKMDFDDDEFAKQKITVEDEPMVGTSLSKNSFNRATNFIYNQKVLILDDIPRIVAAEHARELRPNTYKFHNPHQDDITVYKDSKRKSSLSKGINATSNTETDLNGNLKDMRSTIKADIKPVDVKYYSELTENETLLVTHISLVLLRHTLSKYKVEHSIVINRLIDQKRSPTFWDKLRSLGSTDGSDKKTINLAKVFGSDLKDLTLKTGVDSSQSNGPSKVRIPILIEDLLTVLYQKDMSTEGVFRKNGNIRRLKEIATEIDNNPSKVPDLMNENVVQLSALLKKFLRELPDPLLTFKLYDLWILSQKVKKESLKKLLIEISYSLLPKCHRDLAQVLLFFFMWTSSFSHLDEQSGSKMDIHNLATVISPNILFSKPAEIKSSGNSNSVANTYYDAFNEGEGENYYLAIEVVDYLISHNEELIVIPPFILNILSKCKIEKIEQQTSKELMTKIDLVLKTNPYLLNDLWMHSDGSSSNIEVERTIVKKFGEEQQAIKPSIEQA